MKLLFFNGADMSAKNAFCQNIIAFLLLKLKRARQAFSPIAQMFGI
jgi:hypothetical protein